MLSISFLPWMLLLLGIVLSVPIVGMVESKRRKRELAAARAELEAQQRELEVANADGELPDEGAAVAVADGADAFSGFGGGAASGQASPFDDDAFK
jgi:hypothetical protein